MGSTTQIEQELRTTRADLSDNIGELQDRIKGTFDWRTQVNERPGTMLALAFGGGIILSALIPRGRSNGQAHSEFTPSSQTAKIINAVKGALVGAAVTKASAFVEELLPGFKDEFARAKTS